MADLTIDVAVALARKAGLLRITANYSGSGDFGQFEGYTYRMRKGRTVDAVPADVRTTIEEALEQVVESRCDLPDNGDGGFGTYTWHLATGRITGTTSYYETKVGFKERLDTNINDHG